MKSKLNGTTRKLIQEIEILLFQYCLKKSIYYSIKLHIGKYVLFL
jgi:hypothetical protein